LDAGRGGDEAPAPSNARRKRFQHHSFAWSHDEASIAFSADQSRFNSGVTSDIYVLKLSDDSVKKIDQPGLTAIRDFRPMINGRFPSVMGEKIFFASNSWLGHAQGGPGNLSRTVSTKSAA
jgi:hypothetical protein